MLDKRMSPKEMIAQIPQGATIGIGGWSMSRKPMPLIRELARSDLKALTLVTCGGYEADLLIALGKVKKVWTNFIAFDFTTLPPVPPNFRNARQKGEIEVIWVCENNMMAGLKGAAERLAFYPTRTLLGTDMLKVYPEIQTFKSPYSGETLVAMPALACDVSLLHVPLADWSGNCVISGNPDFDPPFAKASKKTFVTAEKVVSPAELKPYHDHLEILRIWVTGVAEAPFGAHPGLCQPDYNVDQGHLEEYLKAAGDSEGLKKYVKTYITEPADHTAYLEKIGLTKLLQLRKGA